MADYDSDDRGPANVPPLPEDPVDAAMMCTYRHLREIPAQNNLLNKKLILTTRAGLVMNVMQDAEIMSILKQQLVFQQENR